MMTIAITITIIITIIIITIIITIIIILVVILGYILPSIQHETKKGVGAVDIGKNCRLLHSYGMTTATINGSILL